MKTYIGVKIVKAWPQDEDVTKIAAEAAMGALTGETLRPARPGYAVQYADGYESWSPKDVFEAAYREVPGDDPENDGLRPQDILAMTNAFIGRCLSPADELAAADAAYDRRRDRDIRETAVHLAVKTGGTYYPLPLDMREVFMRASQIAAYINEGVVMMPEAKEE